MNPTASWELESQELAQRIEALTQEHNKAVQNSQVLRNEARRLRQQWQKDVQDFSEHLEDRYQDAQQRYRNLL